MHQWCNVVKIVNIEKICSRPELTWGAASGLTVDTSTYWLEHKKVVALFVVFFSFLTSRASVKEIISVFVFSDQHSSKCMFFSAMAVLLANTPPWLIVVVVGLASELHSHGIRTAVIHTCATSWAVAHRQTRSSVSPPTGRGRPAISHYSVIMHIKRVTRNVIQYAVPDEI